MSQGLHNGAYYLAGYALECALKACIAKRTRRYEFPEKKRVDSSHTHNLRELVKIAGLEDARRPLAVTDEKFRRDSLQTPLEYYPEAVGDRQQGIIAWLMFYW